MSSMPEVIAKGGILRKLETVLNDRPNRETIWNALEAGTPLLTITSAAPHDLGLTAGEQDHLQQDWLANLNWEGIVRLALTTALQRAMNPDTGDPPPPGPPGRQLDIDCYWICSPGHGPGHGNGRGHAIPPAAAEPLEVSISWNDRQVTVLFHAADPRHGAPAQNPEDIVVVKLVAGNPQVVPVFW